MLQKNVLKNISSAQGVVRGRCIPSKLNGVDLQLHNTPDKSLESLGVVFFQIVIVSRSLKARFPVER